MQGTVVRTFPMGRLIATSAFLEAVPRHKMIAALKSHAARDWRLCGEEAARFNDWRLENDLEVVSVHEHEGTRFLCVTDGDRRRTRLLLPGEY
jgi:hypothetical protein